MDWIQHAVRDFAATLGIEALEFDASQGVELMMDSGELVGIACLPELPSQEMLVYASAALQFDPLLQLEQALLMSNARHDLSPPVQAVIVDRQLVLAVHLPTREFDLPALDEAVGRLIARHHDATAQNAF